MWRAVERWSEGKPPLWVAMCREVLGNVQELRETLLGMHHGGFVSSEGGFDGATWCRLYRSHRRVQRAVLAFAEELMTGFGVLDGVAGSASLGKGAEEFQGAMRTMARNPKAALDSAKSSTEVDVKGDEGSLLLALFQSMLRDDAWESAESDGEARQPRPTRQGARRSPTWSSSVAHFLSSGP